MKTYPFKKYFLDRLVRLYVVLIPALFLAGILHYILIRFSGENSIALTIEDFIGSLLFVQTIFTQPFAHNGPLWSLANEFWYYILFPIMIFIYINKNRVLSLTVTLLLILFLPWKLILYFSIWLSGVVLFCLKKKILPLYLSLILFIISILISRLHLLENLYLSDILITISFVFLVNSMQYSNEFKIWTRLDNINKTMANFSYSTYLLHMPLLYLIVYLLKNTTDINFSNINMISFLVFLTSLFIILIYSYLISLVTENKTHIVKKYIYKIGGLK